MATIYGASPPLERPANALTSVAEAMRVGGEKAVAGQRELADIAVKQATENVEALFGSFQTMIAASSSADAATLYIKFLGDTSQRYTKQIKAIGDIISRSSKDAWQPMVEAVASARSAAAAPMTPAG